MEFALHVQLDHSKIVILMCAYLASPETVQFAPMEISPAISAPMDSPCRLIKENVCKLVGMGQDLQLNVTMETSLMETDVRQHAKSKLDTDVKAGHKLREMSVKRLSC